MSNAPSGAGDSLIDVTSDTAIADIPLVSIPSVLDGMPTGSVMVDGGPDVAWRLEVPDQAVQAIAPQLREAVETLGVTHHRLRADAFEDLLIVCRYSLAP